MNFKHIYDANSSCSIYKIISISEKKLIPDCKIIIIEQWTKDISEEKVNILYKFVNQMDLYVCIFLYFFETCFKRTCGKWPPLSVSQQFERG